MDKDTVYANGYTFTIDRVTGTTTAKGLLQNDKADRDSSVQIKAGGNLREGTDQGGHLVAAQLNGPHIPENTFAQNGNLNQGSFKAVENAEKNLISDPEEKASIQTERIAYAYNPTKGDDMRPEAYMINDTITYADGNTQTVHLSFANMSRAEQEEMNNEINELPFDDMPNPGDTLRDSMSVQEYSELMEETDAYLPGLKDEFEEHVSSSEYNLAAEENNDMDYHDHTAEQENTWDFEISQEDTMDTSVGNHWDFEAENDSSASVDAGDTSIDDGIDSSFDDD